MAKYLVQSRYTAEGAEGLLKEGGTGRRRMVEDVVTGLGGTVEAMYYTYGESDLMIIIDFPDDTSMAAVSMAVKASGMLTPKATELLTPDQMDQAVRQHIAYRAPGA